MIRVQRKRLQCEMQTFATVPANVCNRPRKRLQERMQTISPHRSIIATQIIPTQNRHDVPPRGDNIQYVRYYQMSSGSTGLS